MQFNVTAKQLVKFNDQTIPLPTVGTCCGNASGRARIVAMTPNGPPVKTTLHGRFLGLVQAYTMTLEPLGEQPR